MHDQMVEENEKTNVVEYNTSQSILDRKTWRTILEALKLKYRESDCGSIAEEGLSISEVKQAFSCLLEFIDTYLLPVNERLRKRQGDTVKFSELWHLFRVGGEIVTNDGSAVSHALVMRVLRTDGGRRRLRPFQAPYPDSNRSSEDSIKPINNVNPFCVLPPRLPVARLDETMGMRYEDQAGKTLVRRAETNEEGNPSVQAVALKALKKSKKTTDSNQAGLYGAASEVPKKKKKDRTRVVNEPDSSESESSSEEEDPSVQAENTKTRKKSKKMTDTQPRESYAPTSEVPKKKQKAPKKMESEAESSESEDSSDSD
ncbi:hypothetical protein EJ08DRAFT_528534 [Tothia fuscella]|uniref:Uncharacterized protein n=1 Tax=Tothia fuscella TaxID=1048955 RepID=A0A9P4NGF9_9PEZI|nr:hypothetical protein EJ08DRAFT_528534 [Tothia fuscella]